MIDKLQALVPRRLLSRDEALAITELQAARLRGALGANDGCLTDRHLLNIPGVRVEVMNDLGVSGATRRVGNLWVILINKDEANVRQRFSIAHELKHILDDEATLHLYRRGLLGSGKDWMTERLCDYFAACLLMPRLWVKRAWVSGSQDLVELSRLFDVSIDAMRIRLNQLGLVEPASRCSIIDLNQKPLPARVAA